MADRPLADRITRQFSGESDRSDIWAGFEAFLDVDAYLNLGYSRRYQTHLIGSPQRRLADYVLTTLQTHRRHGDERLLDLGCGRGGPTSLAAERYDWQVLGVDLVPHNVALARERAELGSTGRSDPASGSRSFLVGDATALPLVDDSFDAAIAIDSIVYVPEPERSFAELERVLGPHSIAVVTDLLASEDARSSDLEAFASAWDMPPPRSHDRYRKAIDAAGLTVLCDRDLSPYSISRFRAWTWLYRRLLDSPGRVLLERAMDRRRLDIESVSAQIEAAHAVLPTLNHRFFVLENR